MKYLKRYNEIRFIGTSPMKSDINDILLELKDEDFGTFISKEEDVSSIRRLGPTNEELKSNTYKSAADKLAKLGHKQRPEELMKWHEITKQKENDAMKLATLNDCKQLGVYQIYLSYRKDGKTYDYKGDFYINLTFDSYSLNDSYSEWKEGQGDLWISFSVGVIPITEEGQQFCSVNADEAEVRFIDSTFYIGEFWLNISRSIPSNADESNDHIRFKPEGIGYFDMYEGNWHLSNRASAMRFKNSLYRIFSGDIIVRETSQMPGGMKEEIIDQLCNVREHDIDEYEDIMNSIKNIRINELYKD